jgi:hypothetical protein
VCNRWPDIRTLSATVPHPPSVNNAIPGCRHNSRPRPEGKGQVGGTFLDNRPWTGTGSQQTVSYLVLRAWRPGKREGGLGATRLVPNDPFCPLPIRGRHGIGPLVPEAREMVDIKASPQPPSRPRGSSHAEPGGSLVRRIEPLSAVQKEIYDQNSCVTGATIFGSHFGQKEEADTQTSPHVPCLRLIDRAGVSFP